jgi:hypothetical protein
MHQALGKVAVIGKNEQTFRIAVEAADVVKGLQRCGQQVVNRFAPEFIAAGANVAARLVEGDNREIAGRNAASIDPDVIARLDLSGELGAGAAVDLDSTRLDQLIAGAAGPDSAGCEVFVEAGSVFHGVMGKAKGAEPGGIRAQNGKKLQPGLAFVLGLGQADR